MIDKLTQKQINDIAKLISKTNMAMWNAIILFEDMDNKLSEINLDNNEILIKLMKAFKKINNEINFINAEEYSAYFSDFTEYAQQFNMTLEQLED